MTPGPASAPGIGSIPFPRTQSSYDSFESLQAPSSSRTAAAVIPRFDSNASQGTTRTSSNTNTSTDSESESDIESFFSVSPAQLSRRPSSQPADTPAVHIPGLGPEQEQQAEEQESLDLDEFELDNEDEADDKDFVETRSTSDSDPVSESDNDSDSVLSEFDSGSDSDFEEPLSITVPTSPLATARALHSDTTSQTILPPQFSNMNTSIGPIAPGVYTIKNFTGGTVLSVLPGECKVTCSPEYDCRDYKWLVTPVGSGAHIQPYSPQSIPAPYNQSQPDPTFLGPHPGDAIKPGSALGLTGYPLTLSFTKAPWRHVEEMERKGFVVSENDVAIGWPHWAGGLVLDLDGYGRAERGTGVSFQNPRSHFEGAQYWKFIRCESINVGYGYGGPTVGAREVLSIMPAPEHSFTGGFVLPGEPSSSVPRPTGSGQPSSSGSGTEFVDPSSAQENGSRTRRTTTKCVVEEELDAGEGRKVLKRTTTKTTTVETISSSVMNAPSG